MQDKISTYLEQTKSIFHDFLDHEIIRLNPLTITDEEVWQGIKDRSNVRSPHICDFINRMNQYCTCVTIVGHRKIPTIYNTADYGVFKYSFNESSTFEILYSSFRYPHIFSDRGMIRDSFAGDYGNEFYITFDLINDGKRTNHIISPESLFENTSNIGFSVFLEYEIESVNKFNSIKMLPSFVNIDETDSFFLKEVRLSLLKTKVVLLSLVDKYPTHLMHYATMDVLKDSHILLSEFTSLYHKEISDSIRKVLTASNQELISRGISLSLPF